MYSTLHRLEHVARGRLAIAGMTLLLATTPAAALAQDTASDPPQIGPFTDITTYRVNDARTAIQPGTVPETAPGLVWSVKLADEIHFNPLVLDGTVYVATFDGVLHAVDAGTGSVRWTYEAGPIIEGGIIEGGAVVFAERGGKLHGVDAATGEARWALEGDWLNAPAAIAHWDGLIYASTGDGVLHGIDPATGDEVASVDLPAGASSLTIDDGVAYLGTTDGEVVAISLADGTQPWRPVKLLSDRVSSMPVSEGLLFVGSLQPEGAPAGELLAIDTASGKVMWRFRSPSGTQVGPSAVDDGMLYVASEHDGVYAFDVATGSIVWHVDAPTVYTAAPLAGEALILPTVDGDLIALDRTDGKELWRVKAGDGGNSGPAITGGLIFQTDWRGNLMAFGDVRLAQAPVVTDAMTVSDPGVEDVAVGSPFRHLATWDASTIEGLDQPCGGDIGPDDLFYFVNCGTSEVVVLDTDGDVVRRWGGPGTGEGQFDFLRDPNDPFSAAGGVAVAPDGSVYVSDTVNSRIQQFTAEGEFVRQFGSYGDGDGQFLEPFDLDVGPDGTVYVVDDVRDDIQRFSADGKHLQTIGSQGDDDGQMRYTSSVVATDDGRLLNADWENYRVQAWDADGNFLWTVGGYGSDLGEFRLPADVAVDEAGRWFATDFDNGRVQAFSPDNEPLGAWVIPAVDETGPGYAITSAGDGRFYVNLTFGDRIAVIEFA